MEESHARLVSIGAREREQPTKQKRNAKRSKDAARSVCLCQHFLIPICLVVAPRSPLIVTTNMEIRIDFFGMGFSLNRWFCSHHHQLSLPFLISPPYRVGSRRFLSLSLSLCRVHVLRPSRLVSLDPSLLLISPCGPCSDHHKRFSSLPSPFPRRGSALCLRVPSM